MKQMEILLKAIIILLPLVEKIVRKRMEEKKIDYVHRLTSALIEGIHRDTYKILHEKVANSRIFNDEVLNALEKKLDKVSPAELMQYLGLIKKALSAWKLNEEELRAFREKVNKLSYPLDL